MNDLPHSDANPLRQDRGIDSAAQPKPDETSGTTPLIESGFATKANDLEALRDSLVDAGSIGAALWLSYLFVLFYFTVAVGGVTHRDLFFEAPVKLPFLSVDLPLLTFIVLGPVILLILHCYVLLHLVLLSRKVGTFVTQLREQILDESVRTDLRGQLPSNIFIQFLAGPHDVRSGVMGFLLRLVAQISLIAAPIMLLTFFQLQFIAYHDEATTWWHRVAVAADIGLLWLLWPSIAGGKLVQISWRDLRRRKVAGLACLSFVPILLVFTVATFPGELLHTYVPSIAFIPWKDATKPSWRLASLHELLLAGDVNLVTGTAKSFWSNRLVLVGMDVIDHTKLDSAAKIAALTTTVSLRGRHLEGAVLIDAQLTKADFTGAQLQEASLVNAHLDGASLLGAQLQGARLDRAQLGGMNLVGAKLQGAFLTGAQLQGVSLDAAELEGTSFNDAHLEGASLVGAKLQGASFDGAHLEGASLAGALLQGVVFDHAFLRGTMLNFSQLQGASLDGADLEVASLKNVLVWRADIRRMIGQSAYVDAVSMPKRQCVPPENGYLCDWSSASLSRLEADIAGAITVGGALGPTLDRVEQRLSPTGTMDGDREIGNMWADLKAHSPSIDRYESLLTEEWRRIGCHAEGAPFVMRGLARTLATPYPYSPFSHNSQDTGPSSLAESFLDERQCPGGRGLSTEDKLLLTKIRDLAQLRNAPDPF